MLVLHLVILIEGYGYIEQGKLTHISGALMYSTRDVCLSKVNTAPVS